MSHIYHHKVKHYVRRALIGVAFVILFADMIAAIFPQFDAVWRRPAHFCVAFAAFAAFLVEHFVSEEGGQSHAEPTE